MQPKHNVAPAPPAAAAVGAGAPPPSRAAARDGEQWPAAPTHLGRLLVATLDQQRRVGHQLAAVLQVLERSAGAGISSHDSHESPVGLAEPVVSPAGSVGRRAPAQGVAPASRRQQETPRVAVYCLGTFRLVIDGVPVTRWRSGKAQALCQYLATHAGRLIPRQELLDALWPAPDALAAGTSLKVAVHVLRQVLDEATSQVRADQACDGQAGSAQGASGQPLLTVRTHDLGYRLDSPALWLDVAEFERCCALARRLEREGHYAEAMAQYTRAAALYGGDFLPAAEADWAVFRREALKDQVLLVLGRLADAALAAGDFETCLLRCQQVLAHDPCREDAYRLLMLCHGRLGQRGRVRRWYELCVQTLQTDLEVAPEPETERVYQQALRAPCADQAALLG